MALVPQSEPMLIKLASGRMSAIEERREVVVRDQDVWETLWAEHSRLATLPSVDFETEMVLGVFMGTRPTAGFDIEVTEARLEGETLVVRYRERKPERGMMVAQMLSSPYHLVRLARHDGPVTFQPELTTAPDR